MIAKLGRWYYEPYLKSYALATHFNWDDDMALAILVEQDATSFSKISYDYYFVNS